MSASVDDASPTPIPDVRDGHGRSTTDDRLYDIDRAKGLGIALVVWGHIASSATPHLPLWFLVSTSVVYQFHMPFFMYLSGFVFFYIGAQDRFFRSPFAYIAKRFDRLMVPFLAFGLIVVVGKYLAVTFGPISDEVTSIGSGLYKVVENAPDNPSLSIWYLFVLFVYSLITPLLWRLGGRKIWLLLVIGTLGWLVPLPEDYYIRRISVFFIFFAVGGLVALYRDRMLKFMKKYHAPAFLLFGTLCYLLLSNSYSLLLCGLASIPALHGLMLRGYWRNDRALLTLGRYSMAIYLMNTIILGIVRVVYIKALPYEGLYFPAFVMTLFAAGLIGPIILRMLIDSIGRLRFIGRYLT